MLFDNSIDVVEDDICQFEADLLDIILYDRTTRKNIIWATDDYLKFGDDYSFFHEIKPEQITGKHSLLIQPRVSKSKEEQLSRTRDKAEVFTPCWVCNEQNNLIDEQWFGKRNVFNYQIESNWVVNEEKIQFEEMGKRTWQKYVDCKRLEITCGEAPYLVSRYDSVTGDTIPINRRIGLLDRKIRVVNENTETKEDWLKWVLRAFQGSYGFEYQGDNLLLARENLLMTFIDYYQENFDEYPSKEWLLKIARVISWNIWQMDGIRCVVPNSCKPEIIEQNTLFGVERYEIECPGCKNGDIRKHNGLYCKVMDWRENNSFLFTSAMKGVR